MSMEDAAAPLQIDVISDVMCPWCYIGYKRLKAAQAALGVVPTLVRWRPFQLDPSIPPDGMERREYLLKKFFSEEEIAAMHLRIAEEGAKEGIDFDFAAIRKSPNTLDAHRVIHWAGVEGPDVQDRLVARLFALYFEKGGDLTDAATLADAAAEAGMDREVVAKLLEGDADREEIVMQISQAQQMGVHGVPFYLLEQRYGLSGAQPAEVLADALSQVSVAKAQGEFSA